VQVLEGRYGPYVTHNKVNATVPRAKNPAELTMDEAVALLAERIANGGGKKGKPARGAKAKAAKEEKPAKAAKAPKAAKSDAPKEPAAKASKSPAKKSAPAAAPAKKLARAKA
jgi:DNA topoisomerase-1